MAVTNVGLQAVLHGATQFTASAQAMTRSTSQLTASLLGVSRQGGVIENQLKRLAFVASGVFVAMGISAMIRGLDDVSNKWERFDQEITNAISIMERADRAMRDHMETAARDMAKQLPISAEQAAAGFKFLAAAGLGASESIGALPVVSRLAVAGNIEMQRSSELLMQSQAALGLRSKDTAKNIENLTFVADLFAKAANISTAEVEDFADATANKGGAAARTFNISATQMVATLSAFANVGIKGRVAGEQFSIMLRDVQRAAIEHVDVFKKAGIAVFDAQGKFVGVSQVIKQLEDRFVGLSDMQRRHMLMLLGFQQRSIGAMLAVLGQSEAIREMEAELQKANGTLREMSDVQTQSLQNQIKILGNNFSDLSLEVGKRLDGEMRKTINFINSNVIPNLRERLPTAIRAAKDAFKGLRDGMNNLREFIERNLTPILQLLAIHLARTVAGAAVSFALSLASPILQLGRIGIAAGAATVAVLAFVASSLPSIITFGASAILSLGQAAFGLGRLIVMAPFAAILFIESMVRMGVSAGAMALRFVTITVPIILGGFFNMAKVAILSTGIFMGGFARVGAAALIMAGHFVRAFLVSIAPAVVTAMTVVTGALLPVLVPLIGLGLAALALKTAWETNFLGMRNVVQGILNVIGSAILRFLDFLMAIPGVGDVLRGIASTISGIANVVVAEGPKIVQAGGDVIGGFVEGLKGGFPEVQRTIKDMMGIVDPHVPEVLKDLDESLASAKRRADESAAAIRNLGDAFDENQPKIGLAADNQRIYNDLADDGAKKSKKAGNEIKRSMDDVTEGLERFQDAVERATREYSQAWEKAGQDAREALTKEIEKAAQETERIAEDARRRIEEEMLSLGESRELRRRRETFREEQGEETRRRDRAKEDAEEAQGIQLDLERREREIQERSIEEQERIIERFLERKTELQEDAQKRLTKAGRDQQREDAKAERDAERRRQEIAEREEERNAEARAKFERGERELMSRIAEAGGQTERERLQGELRALREAEQERKRQEVASQRTTRIERQIAQPIGQRRRGVLVGDLADIRNELTARSAFATREAEIEEAIRDEKSSEKRKALEDDLAELRDNFAREQQERQENLNKELQDFEKRRERQKADKQESRDERTQEEQEEQTERERELQTDLQKELSAFQKNLKDRLAEERKEAEQRQKERREDIELRRRREDEDLAFRKKQDAEQRAFEDKLEEEALAKRIKNIKAERDERIKAIQDALAQKTKDIEADLIKEREALLQNYKDKISDLETNYLEKIDDKLNIAGGKMAAFIAGVTQQVRNMTADAVQQAERAATAIANIPGNRGGGAPITRPGGGSGVVTIVDDPVAERAFSSMHSGGVVPGVPGTERLVRLIAGERVINPAAGAVHDIVPLAPQLRAMGLEAFPGRGGDTHYVVHASYQNAQSPAAVRDDLAAMVMLARS